MSLVYYFFWDTVNVVSRTKKHAAQLPKTIIRIYYIML